MLTTATNFLARHAFVVMPKTSRKTIACLDCSSPIRCPTARCCTTAACSSSSSAARPRRCGCCCTTASTDRDPSRRHRLQPADRPLGRHLEHVRARPQGRPALPLPGRRAVRSRARAIASIRKARLIDPYARALAGEFLPADDGIIRPPKCVVVDDTFDWKGDRHLQRPLVRNGHLRDARPRLHAQRHRAASKHPGTYLGVIEKIPYLKSLGVTAVELMPVHEFPIERHATARSRAPELLGLRPAGVLRAAPRLLHGQRAGRPGAAVQADGPRAARGRHRSDSRRRLQPHGRRQRARARRSASRAWRTASTTC